MKPPFPSDDAGASFGDRPRPALPAFSAGAFGMALLLASLTMLFGAGLAAYLLVRYRSADAPPAGTLELPVLLWASTALLIGSTASAHLARRSRQRQAAGRMRKAVYLTFGLGVGFIVVQTPALIQLLTMHESGGAGLYGMAFTLIILHAAHVIGGMGPMGWLALRCYQRRLEPRHLATIRHCATYWHFLDAVWLAMLAMFLVTA